MADYGWMTDTTKPKNQAIGNSQMVQRDQQSSMQAAQQNRQFSTQAAQQNRQSSSPSNSIAANASRTYQELPAPGGYGQAGAGYGGYSSNTPSNSMAANASRTYQQLPAPGNYGQAGAGYGGQTQASGYGGAGSGYGGNGGYSSNTPSNPFTSTQSPARTQFSLPTYQPQGSAPVYSAPAQRPFQPSQSPSFGSGYDVSQYGPGSFPDKNEPLSRYIENTLPLAQFGQNQYQFDTQFNEDARRWDATFGQQQTTDSHAMGLADRQQLADEEAQRVAAEQWNSQFDWTKQTDAWGYDLGLQDLGIRSQDVQNQFTVGMDQNQATRDVANTYAGAQRYGADQQLAGTLGSANIYAGAQNYAADQNLAGVLGSAGMYSNAQMYGADQSRIAQMYGADQQLAGAGLYAGAQRYGAELGLQGTTYGWDTQAAMNQALMQNNLQVAAMNTYGRSAAPRASWAMQWS